MSYFCRQFKRREKLPFSTWIAVIIVPNFRERFELWNRTFKNDFFAGCVHQFFYKAVGIIGPLKILNSYT